MVIDAEGDTGFVMPIKTAKELVNLRFRVLPPMLDTWTEVKKLNVSLKDQIKNLEEQNTELQGIADRNKTSKELLEERLDDTEKTLKKKALGLKIYRMLATVLGISTAVLLIAK